MKVPQPSIKLSLLTTGDELIRSTILDTNADYLTKELSNIGISVFQKVTTGDTAESIATALGFLSRNNDIVIVNGGLGATSDDKTIEGAAIASKEKLAKNEEAVRQVSRNVQRIHRNIAQFPERMIKKFTVLPKSAKIISNDSGIAVGFKIKISRAICYFTPGVPSELIPMFQNHIAHDIQKIFTPKRDTCRCTVYFIGMGETEIEKRVLHRLTKEESKNIRIGLRAHSPYVDVTLDFPNEMNLKAQRTVKTKICEILPQYILPNDKGVAHEIVHLLNGEKRHLAVAESCTGGRVASLLTAVSGASDVFEAGLVTYSNQAKINLLDVPRKTIETHGAVSARVVERMVKGLLKRTNADYGLAISGIAGPTGGTDEKPIGTVYIGWGDRDGVSTRKLLIKRLRNEFQTLAAITSLDLIRRYLLNYELGHPYFFDTSSTPG